MSPSSPASDRSRPLAIALGCLLALVAATGCLGSADGAEAAPACPEDVRVTDREGDAVRLAWNVSAYAETYHVYRASEGEGQHLAQVNDTRFTDRDVEPDVVYEYQVTAANATGEAEDCPTVEAAAVPVFTSPLAAGLAALAGVSAVAVLQRLR